MLPWAEEKYLSEIPADISVYLWLAQDAIFGYRYPTIEISGGHLFRIRLSLNRQCTQDGS